MNIQLDNQMLVNGMIVNVTMVNYGYYNFSYLIYTYFSEQLCYRELLNMNFLTQIIKNFMIV